MEVKELVKALKNLQVQTGSLACLGCGHEHGCGMHGCAILRDSANLLESMQEELDRVKAERDAAVSALTDMVNEYRRETSGTDFCGLCEYDLPPAGENGQMAECPGFYRDDCFKWCGLEGRTK